jgi:hypothetical protein
MYSFYLLRHSVLVANNGDTMTDCYVLGRRADLMLVLADLELSSPPDETDECQLEVYEGGQLRHRIDLMANMDLEDFPDEDATYQLDLTGITIPDLVGKVLPPGHPVVVDDEVLHYGCTGFYW